MREIKFRLRDRDNTIVGYEKWYPGSWDSDHETYAADPKWLYSKDGEYWNPTYIWHRYKDQATNLLDKNGKEIYEGDIVKVAHGIYKPDTDPNHADADYSETTEYVNYQVQYDRCQWTKLSWGQLYFKPYMTKAEYKLIRSKPFQEWYSNMWFLEVIGNIYENPELLTSHTNERSN